MVWNSKIKCWIEFLRLVFASDGVRARVEKRSHKPDSAYDYVAYNPWKLDCRSGKQKRKNQPITMLGLEKSDWFILPFLLPTPTMQFSLDHKRRSHKRNRYSASIPTPTVWFSLDCVLRASDYDSDSDARENQPYVFAQIFHILWFHIILCQPGDVTRPLTCINQNLE